MSLNSTLNMSKLEASYLFKGLKLPLPRVNRNRYDYHKFLAETAKFAKFNEIIWHPKFEESYKFHDVAVLKLKEQFKYSSSGLSEIVEYNSIEKMTENLIQALTNGNRFYPQNDKGWYGLLDI